MFDWHLEAFRRGHCHPGEVSRIVGGGPVPVSMVREALGNDGFLKAVIHDGVRIDTVVHYGRHIKAELRTALGLGKPPHFSAAPRKARASAAKLVPGGA